MTCDEMKEMIKLMTLASPVFYICAERKKKNIREEYERKCECVFVSKRMTRPGRGRQPHPPEMMRVTGGSD